MKSQPKEPYGVAYFRYLFGCFDCPSDTTSISIHFDIQVPPPSLFPFLSSSAKTHFSILFSDCPQSIACSHIVPTNKRTNKPKPTEFIDLIDLFYPLPGQGRCCSVVLIKKMHCWVVLCVDYYLFVHLASPESSDENTFVNMNFGSCRSIELISWIIHLERQ